MPRSLEDQPDHSQKPLKSRWEKTTTRHHQDLNRVLYCLPPLVSPSFSLTDVNHLNCWEWDNFLGKKNRSPEEALNLQHENSVTSPNADNFLKQRKVEFTSLEFHLRFPPDFWDALQSLASQVETKSKTASPDATPPHRGKKEPNRRQTENATLVTFHPAARLIRRG